MDKLLKDMQDKGLIGIIKVRGKAKAVFGYIKIMATTVPIEEDPIWWQVRLLTMNWN